MKYRAIKADGQLLLTAMIWGFAFVAQRVGMDHVGPFGFNAARFTLGSLSLVPVLWWLRRRNSSPEPSKTPQPALKTLMTGGLWAGVILYGGSSLQQIGLVYTTAGKAGFITGLYVVIVPIIGLMLGQKTHAGTWIGAGTAAIGLYLLSITGDFKIAFGDLLVLLGAFCWSAHVLVIDHFSGRIAPIFLAFMQFSVCAFLSLATALVVEFDALSLSDFKNALIPILYAGGLSVGVAYTLQVVAQKNARPAHAAIILSLEAAFAALGGWLILGETLSLRGMTGCALMLAGMIASQIRLPVRRFRTTLAVPPK